MASSAATPETPQTDEEAITNEEADGLEWLFDPDRLNSGDTAPVTEGTAEVAVLTEIPEPAQEIQIPAEESESLSEADPPAEPEETEPKQLWELEDRSQPQAGPSGEGDFSYATRAPEPRPRAQPGRNRPRRRYDPRADRPNPSHKYYTRSKDPGSQ